MATVITIDGDQLNLEEFNAWPGVLTLRSNGVSDLSLTKKGGPLPELPDPLINHKVQVYIDETLRFTGYFERRLVNWTNLGWVVTYQALDLWWRGDKYPFIDSNTLTTTANFNRTSEDPLYSPSRSGMTVGEVIQTCLQMDTNAQKLMAEGIGGYTYDSGENTYTLPAETLADLALLDYMPPQILSVSGDKCLSAIQSFLASTTANVAMNVLPDGIIRFIRMEDVTENVIYLDDCSLLVSPPSIERSISDCATAINVFGKARTEALLFTLQNGGLEEYFAWGGHTNSEAKSIWTPSDYTSSLYSRSSGSVSVTDTLHVVVTSDFTNQTWDSDQFDQIHLAGEIHLWADIITGPSSAGTLVKRRIVANTALTAGGTSTITLDEPLPATDFTKYQIYAFNTGPGLVYRRYRVADAEIRDQLAREFNPSAVWILSTGDTPVVTNYPMASICWPDELTGTGPPKEVTDDFILDISTGTLTFVKPTYITAGYRQPSDVRALLPITSGSSLSVRVPATGWEGTAYSIDGLEREFQLYQRDWTDPANASGQAIYAQDLLNSMKDAVIDVDLTVNTLYTPALDIQTGQGISVAASGYTTYMESTNLPITATSLTWNLQGPTDYTVNIRASNRRSALQPSNFLAPERPRSGFTWGSQEVMNPLNSNKESKS